MQQFIFIGTIHCKLTPNKELQEILEELQPDQLLIEIVEKDLNNKNFKNYPSEMIFAYQQAIKNKVNVRGFDSPIDILKKGKTQKDEDEVIKEVVEIMKSHTWKEMNKKEIIKLLDTPRYLDLMDWKSYQEREHEMLNNILNVSIDEGKIVIITGASHLNFFEEKFKNALFPLRH